MAQKDNGTHNKLTFDANAIRELAALMDETGLTEIEVAEGERRIRVGKHPAVAATPLHAVPHIAASPSATEAAPQLSAQTQGAVTSPMVGTAYLRPDPTSPPFVRAGDTVSAGDTLLIIEAMKVMNPIKAEKPGRVVRIAVSDAQPIEFGEVLMIIE